MQIVTCATDEGRVLRISLASLVVMFVGSHVSHYNCEYVESRPRYANVTDDNGMGANERQVSTTSMEGESIEFFCVVISRPWSRDLNALEFILSRSRSRSRS